jgi:hypothetical protein
MALRNVIEILLDLQSVPSLEMSCLLSRWHFLLFYVVFFTNFCILVHILHRTSYRGEQIAKAVSSA